MTFGDSLIRSGLTTCAALVLAAGWLMLMQLSRDLPRTVRLEALQVTLELGAQPVILGSAALIQPEDGPTAERHIALSRRSNGAILAHDIAPDRRLGYVETGEPYTDTGQLRIPEGPSTIRIGAMTWTAIRDGPSLRLQSQDGDRFVALTPGGVQMREAGQVWRGRVAWFEHLRGLFLGGMNLRYRIGGGDVGDARSGYLNARLIPVPDLPHDAASLVYNGREFSLYNALVPDFAGEWSIAADRTPVELESSSGQVLVPEATAIELVSAAGARRVERLVIGRTTYTVEVLPGAQGVSLTPVARRARVLPQDVTALADPRVSRVQTGATAGISPRGLFQAILLAIGLASLLVLTLWRATTRRHLALGLALGGAVLVLGPAENPVRSAAMGLAGGVGVVLWPIALAIVAWSLHLLRSLLRLARLLGRPGGTARVLPDRSQRPPLRQVLRLAVDRFTALVVVLMLALILWQAAPRLAGLEISAQGLSLAGLWLTLAAPFFALRLPHAAGFVLTLVAMVSIGGVLAGLHLSLLEETDAYGRLFDRHLVALAAIFGAAALILSIESSGRARGFKQWFLPNRRSFWEKLILTLTSIFFFLLTLFGDETGFFGLFQPSEISKSVLIVLIAVTLSQDLARRTMISAREGAFDLTPAIMAMLFATAILVASAANYDMSPILVCVVSMIVALFAGSIMHVSALRDRGNQRRLAGLPVASISIPLDQIPPEAARQALRRRRMLRSGAWPVWILALVLTGVFTLVLVVATTPSFRENAPFELFEFLLTPWARIQSWLDMGLTNPDRLIDMPETGEQLRLAREALLTAECRWLSWPCPVPETKAIPPEVVRSSLLRVPAIQDDFAAVSLAIFLGIDGAVVYSGLQGALVATAVAIGLKSMRMRGDRRIAGRIVGCMVLGLAALYLSQVLLAWGNVLGVFPIMGQPMTFVSFGGSHHIGVALPFVTATVVATCVNLQPAADLGAARAMLLRRRLT